MINQNQYLDFLKNVQGVKYKIRVDLPAVDDEKYWFVYPEGFGCHGGKETAWIASVGDFSPCIFLGGDFSVGNVKNEKYLDLWAKAKNAVKLCGNETCNNCSEYRKCRGGCRARALLRYKDINAVDPFCALRKNKL